MQNHSEISVHMCQMSTIEKARDKCRCGERGPLVRTVGGHVSRCGRYGKQHGGSSKIKNTTAIRPSNPTSEYTAKGNEIPILKRYLHPMLTAALLARAKIWKQP